MNSVATEFKSFDFKSCFLLICNGRRLQALSFFDSIVFLSALYEMLFAVVFIRLLLRPLFGDRVFDDLRLGDLRLGFYKVLTEIRDRFLFLSFPSLVRSG